MSTAVGLSHDLEGRRERMKHHRPYCTSKVLPADPHERHNWLNTKAEQSAYVHTYKPFTLSLLVPRTRQREHKFTSNYTTQLTIHKPLRGPSAAPFRWGDLRTSRRSSFETNRARREAERELKRPPRLGAVASAARTVVLAQALHVAGEPVRLFTESAGNGPHAAAAAKTVKAAAAAFPRAHRAVRSVVAAAGGGVAGGGGIQLANGDSKQDRGDGLRGTKNRAMVEEGAGGGKGFAGAEVEVNGRTGGGGGGGGSSGGRAGEAVAVEILAMEREDAMARASACREALGEWWERQRAAVEDGLQGREKEAADRR